MKTPKPPPTIKCRWCGQIVPLNKGRKRPKQHRNGATTCVGSGQPVLAHQGGA